MHARDNIVGLRFKSGINAAAIDNGRGRIAVNLCRLLRDASADLCAMIAQGIEIPKPERQRRSDGRQGQDHKQG
jgi:hypothetical protein